MFDFGRQLVNSPHEASQREWLVTNGIGGFAAGTISGVLTRRYHGLLVAALEPPLGRTLLVSRVDETVTYGGDSADLYSNSWAPNSIWTNGHLRLDRFHLEGTTPVWTYSIADALLEKRVWMAQGANTTFINYRLTRASEPLQLKVKTLINYRGYHASTRADNWQIAIHPTDNGLVVTAHEKATPFYLLSASAKAEAAHAWYRDYYLATEDYRGLESREDHLFAGTFNTTLLPNSDCTIVLSTDPSPSLNGKEAYQKQKQYEQSLLVTTRSKQAEAPAHIQQLALAADQFIVQRTLPNQPDGRTIIAGYPWFGDWGRDTMIALPGLTLTTGRPDVAMTILKTFANFVDEGMLPNRFPDGTTEPEYNTVDATLWYFEAIRATFAATGDRDLVADLFPVLEDIVEWHIKGTRFNIRQDRYDGLLTAGVSGQQLTWMDAKVGEWVVTPRVGKPVEVNALWYNALCIMADFAEILGLDRAKYDKGAARVQSGFGRFWHPIKKHLLDVIDTPEGPDASLRPNQLFAVSLPHSPLSAEQQKAVVDACARTLLTPHGLRSLAASEPAFRPTYGGDTLARDGAYHQGTVWGWLIGPFVAAHLRVYNDKTQARQFIAPLLRHLSDACIGSASEIFDGTAPYTPRGCFAQAWTIAEILRVWELTNSAES